MKFVTIRELRSKTATIRKDLAQEREIVLTANGRPFAVVTPVEPDSVEEELQAIRRARTKVAVERLRTQARAKGLDRLTMDEIDAIVAETRRARRGSAEGRRKNAETETGRGGDKATRRTGRRRPETRGPGETGKRSKNGGSRSDGLNLHRRPVPEP